MTTSGACVGFPVPGSQAPVPATDRRGSSGRTIGSCRPRSRRLNAAAGYAVMVMAALLAGATAGSAQSPEWNATLMVSSSPSPYLSEWERNPQTLRLTLLYTGPPEREYRVEGTLRAAGGELVRAESPPLHVLPGPTSAVITSSDLFDWRVVPATRSVVERALQTGLIPEGEYEVCARVLSLAGLQLAEACSYTTITSPDRPELIFPAPGHAVTGLQPAFQWTPVIVPPALGVAYRVRIVELRDRQTPRTALETNIPHLDLEVAGAPMLVYPADGLPLETGRTYVWQVEALDAGGGQLAPGGLRSEVWAFTMEDAFAVTPFGDDHVLDDRLTVIPGVAYLAGLAQVEVERTTFGYMLEGAAILHLEAPFESRVRVRLQGLEVDAAAGGLRIVGGRVIGAIEPGMLPQGIAGQYARFEQIEYSPGDGLRLTGALTLPGGATSTLSGAVHVTAAGLYGVLEARGSAGAPLARLGADPVAVRVTVARLQLPRADLELEGELDVFGTAGACQTIAGPVGADGVWRPHVGCTGAMSGPLAAGTAGGAVRMIALAGSLEASPASGTGARDRHR
jgi:hypothetical protein